MSEILCKVNGPLMLEIAAGTAVKLVGQQEALRLCKWSDGESNTDTDYSNLACICAEEVWEHIKYRHDLGSIRMTAKSPDINCIFSKDDMVVKHKIELKSSKQGVIPGSTLGKLDFNQPIIFCHRTKTGFDIRYGQYHSAMSESDTDLFQNRTPRPYLNFTKLVPPQTPLTYLHKNKDDWIPHFAKAAVNRIGLSVHKKGSWQDPLVKRIIYEATKDITTLEALHELIEFVRPTDSDVECPGPFEQ